MTRHGKGQSGGTFSRAYQGTHALGVGAPSDDDGEGYGDGSTDKEHWIDETPRIVFHCCKGPNSPVYRLVHQSNMYWYVEKKKEDAMGCTYWEPVDGVPDMVLTALGHYILTLEKAAPLELIEEPQP